MTQIHSRGHIAAGKNSTHTHRVSQADVSKHAGESEQDVSGDSGRNTHSLIWSHSWTSVWTLLDVLTDSDRK